MPLFWVDEENKIFKNYEDLVNDLNLLSSVNLYAYEKSVYKIIVQIIAGLLSGKNVTLLDNDYSETELINLGVDLRQINEKSENISLSINSYKDIPVVLNKFCETSAITLFTSGTTGKPKKVTQSLKNLSRNVRTGKRYEDNIWAFAYNITHFAGLQVLLQALYNINSLVYVFGYPASKAAGFIMKQKITNISATPSFYRMVMPLIDKPVTSVKNITMGGERFDPQLNNTLKEKFPEAKVTNIYASTEAGSLFNSGDETFTIYNDSLIRISAKNELTIHKDLLGESDSFTLDGDWYNTGDIVERTGDNTFKFIAREKEFINIGGYKINPLEIEDKIKELEFINDVKVLSRQNSLLGQVLIANVILSPNIDRKEAKKQINQYLGASLQKWKIPSVYYFTDKLSLTKSGKKEIS